MDGAGPNPANASIVPAAPVLKREFACSNARDSRAEEKDSKTVRAEAPMRSTGAQTDTSSPEQER
eukprot:3816107-Rhodomonas_salina.1